MLKTSTSLLTAAAAARIAPKSRGARKYAYMLLCGLSLALGAARASAEELTCNFAFNSAELTAQARNELDQVAAVLSDPNVEGYSIVIHGHTDGVGSVQYNLRLSERRAEAVRQYFIAQHGIDPNRLIAKGHGKSQLLLAANPTNEANRRVELILFGSASRVRTAAGKDAGVGPG